MRSLARVAVICAAFAVAAWAPAQNKWALIIGIDKYDSDGINPLRYAEADAKALARTLSGKAGYDPAKVFLMTGSSQGADRPTLVNVVKRLAALARRIESEDTLLIYFSGHGYSKEKQGFLATVDCDPTDLETLKITSLQLATLREKLEEIKARSVIVMLDACRNNPERGKGDGDNPLDADLSKDIRLTARRKSDGGATSTAILFACAEGERAYEWAEKGHGVFTHLIIEGLEGKAIEPGTGVVTTVSLMDYVQRQALEWCKDAGKRQTPWMDSAGAARLVLANPAPTGGGPARNVERPAPGPVEVVDTRAFVPIESTPSGAKVFVDGVDSGKVTPCIVEIDLGIARERGAEIGVQIEGHKPAVQRLTLWRGPNQALRLTLPRLEPAARPAPPGGGEAKPKPEPAKGDSAPVPAGLSLRRVRDVGATVRFRMTARFTVMGVEARVSQRVTEEIVAAEPNGGYTIETTFSDIKTIVNGEEDEGDVYSETSVYSARGELLEFRSSEPGGSSPRGSNMTNFVAPPAPVKVGERWSVTIPASRNEGIAAKSDFEVLAEERNQGRPAIKIKMTYRESSGVTPAATDATLWIDKETGAILRMEGQCRNIPMAGIGPVSGSFTLLREN